ncbi:F-box/kelch-repeat protein [Raphanus sativus]|uniref:F-box/kelch-repeat protein At4g38940-like n=1 Tax=Raphanus sativus TaxID=3726 RepID=A0A6J0MSY7_RAPSA|nr:F-box/kelch-repeat protein At4g38940-like [Raphanus sativus]KAJ4907402.1 F-box/kelch-repeat protein [Raphanus sativus]
MAGKQQSSEPPSLITSLPQDVIFDILSRLSRFDYPALSLVCKHFRSIAASPELFTTRSLLGRTEQCLYVVLSNMGELYSNRFYILCQKADGERRLGLIPSLPAIHTYFSYAKMGYLAVGSRIYVFGQSTTDRMMSLSIDCVSHTVQLLPSMPVTMCNTVADIIEGRIYVIGYHNRNDWKRKMVVLNTETQMWEPEMIWLDDSDCYICNNSCVVMADKLYTRNSANSFFYDPKENKWETDEMLDLKIWHNACVIDDVLYYLDFYEKELRAYDGKKRCWQVVKGLEALLSETTRYRIEVWSPKTVSYDGKLDLFFHSLRRHEDKLCEVWCAEI